MTFNRFYFLHIPKTGGRYFFGNVLASINDSLNQYGVPRIDEPYAHTGWHKEIDDKTYIVCLFRDPVEQLVSLYSHVMVLNNRGERRVPVGDLELTKEDMFSWFNKDVEGVKNFQSKNFLTASEVKNRLSDVSIHSIDQVLSRVQRVNLFISTETLNQVSYKTIVNKITDDLGIPRLTNYISFHRDDYRNPDSMNLRASLTDADKEYIRSLSPIDDQIYSTKSFFWKP